MNYNKIAKTLSTVTNGNQQILTVFEATFRENVSSLDLQILASGIIPSNILSNCLASALQVAADKANSLSMPLVSAQIWNPLTAVLLRDSMMTPRSKIESKPAISKSLTKVKTSAKSTDVSELVSTDQVEKIRTALKHNIPSSGLYNNSHHSHISCVKLKCAFCATMYKQVNITKCIGHKPCHDTGYYPHIGKSLWKMVKGRHNRGEPCKLKVEPIKPGQIPSLNQTKEIANNRGKTTSTSDWAEEVEMTLDTEEPDESIDEFPKSPVYYPTIQAGKRRAVDLDSE